MRRHLLICVTSSMYLLSALGELTSFFPTLRLPTKIDIAIASVRVEGVGANVCDAMVLIAYDMRPGKNPRLIHFQLQIWVVQKADWYRIDPVRDALSEALVTYAMMSRENLQGARRASRQI